MQVWAPGGAVPFTEKLNKRKMAHKPRETSQNRKTGDNKTQFKKRSRYVTRTNIFKRNKWTFWNCEAF